jgi:hypothetical protein
MFNTRPPPSPFPLLLVADPTKEALEEFRSKVVVALDRILANKDAVSRNEAGELAFLLRYRIFIVPSFSFRHSDVTSS